MIPQPSSGAGPRPQLGPAPSTLDRDVRLALGFLIANVDRWNSDERAYRVLGRTR